MNYLQQLLSALQVVHEKSIWHLDIKPLNIMVDRNNHVYLIDFGASKHIEQKNGTLTTSSMLVGSPGYYPPEQSTETMKNIGAWTDIYALGATLYNLLTRRNPPTFDVIISEGRNAFSFPSNISSQTQDLIVRMMKVNRNERPQSVKDILNTNNSVRKQEVEETVICKKDNHYENSQEYIDWKNKRSKDKAPKRDKEGNVFGILLVLSLISALIGILGMLFDFLSAQSTFLFIFIPVVIMGVFSFFAAKFD